MTNAETKKKKADKLELFQYFGMDISDSGGDNVLGDCLFCGKEKHTYIERHKGLWDCKVCGRQGNISDFLTYIYDGLLEQTTDYAYVKLASYRKLPVDTFKKWGVAYHPSNETYFFPVTEFDGKISNLYYYRIGQKMLSLPGCDLGIFGLYELLHNGNKRDWPIFIHEGEFNCIATDWLLTVNDQKGLCISTHGANGFKSAWTPYFSNRKVVICNDNDGAGNVGVERVHKILEPLTKKPHYVLSWPEELVTGYDTNDFISAYGVGPNKPSECWEKFSGLFVDYDSWRNLKLVVPSQQAKDPSGKNVRQFNQTKIDPELPPKGVITTQDMIKQYARILELNNDLTKAIKLCLAITLSIKVPGSSPCWMFLQGPPGSGKTEIISSFKASDNFAYYQSSLRRHSLISGMPGLNGTDPSLIPKLHNKCLFLKDYTEVLDKNSEDRREIYGTFRGAFDGYIDRDFGNGVKRIYDPITFSYVAGVTNEILNHSDASVGERFFRFKLNMEGVDLDAQQEAAMKNQFKKNDIKEQVQNAVNMFLSQEWDFSEEAVEKLIGSGFRRKIGALARLSAWLRTPVVRHQWGINRHELAYEPEPELGNRLAIQWQRLGVALATIDRKVQIDDSIIYLIQRIAFDTVTSFSTRVAQIIANSNVPLTRENIVAKMGRIGYTSITNYLEELEITGIVEKPTKIPGENGKPVFIYSLTGEAKDLWQKAAL